MGAWGTEIYASDEACDFADDVAETNDMSRVASALETVLATKDYLELTEGTAGIVAADIVAALRGYAGNNPRYTKALAAWMKRMKLRPDDAMIENAKRVLTRVRTEPSEMLELWTEAEPAEWLASLDELEQRLASIPVQPQPSSFFGKFFRRS